MQPILYIQNSPNTCIYTRLLEDTMPFFKI